MDISSFNINKNKKISDILFHSGRTDENYGHKDLFNISKLGHYHYHHGIGPHLHPCNNISIIDILNKYNMNFFTIYLGLLRSPVFLSELNFEDTNIILRIDISEVSNEKYFGFIRIISKLENDKEESLYEESFSLNSVSLELQFRPNSNWIRKNGEEIDFLVDEKKFTELLEKFINLVKNISKKGKLFIIVDNDLIESKVLEGYSDYVYETLDGEQKALSIYMTNKENEDIAVAVSDKLVTLDSNELIPPVKICNNNKIKVKMNLSSFDLAGEHSFYGVALNTSSLNNEKVISKDGKINVNPTTDKEILKQGIEKDNFHRYYPSFCIDNYNNIKIKWFSGEEKNNSTSIYEAIDKYKTIMPTQQCIVYNSKSVFENDFISDRIISEEGFRIADWDNINEKNYHNNDGIGSFNCKNKIKRSILGHTKEGNFILVCITGNYENGFINNSGGMNLKEIAKMMLELNCDYASNLVGDTTVQMMVNNVNRISSTDKIGSALCVFDKEKIGKKHYGIFIDPNIKKGEELQEKLVGLGYGKYRYVFEMAPTINENMESGKKSVIAHIYKTNPYTEKLGLGISEMPVSLYNKNTEKTNEKLYPLEINIVKLQTNATPLDKPKPDITGKWDLDKYGKNGSKNSFHGINKFKGIVSKDGEIGIKYSDEVTKQYIMEDGYTNYYPSFCIKKDGNVEIRWISYEIYKDRKNLTIEDIINSNEYETILSGQHCLVYNSESVFEDKMVNSIEGYRIADWNDINNRNFHNNDNIGDFNCYKRIRRTFLGHIKNEGFVVICVDGDKDWGTPKNGLNLKEAARMMLDLGCDYAINMDGGSPTQMIFQDSVVVRSDVEELFGEGSYPIGVSICVY